MRIRTDRKSFDWRTILALALVLSCAWCVSANARIERAWDIEAVKKKFAEFSDDDLIAYVQGSLVVGIPKRHEEYRVLILELAKRNDPKLLPLTEQIWTRYSHSKEVEEYWKYGYIKIPNKDIFMPKGSPTRDRSAAIIRERKELIAQRNEIEEHLRILAHKIVFWKKLPGSEIPLEPRRPVKVWDEKRKIYHMKLPDVPNPKLDLKEYVKYLLEMFKEFDPENPEHVNGFIQLSELDYYQAGPYRYEDFLQIMSQSPKACRVILLKTNRHESAYFGNIAPETVIETIRPHLTTGGVVGPYLEWLGRLREKGGLIEDKDGESISIVDVDYSQHKKDYLARERRRLKKGTWMQRWALYEHDWYLYSPYLNEYSTHDKYPVEWLNKDGALVVKIPKIENNDVSFMLAYGGYFDEQRYLAAQTSLVKLLGEKDMPAELIQQNLAFVVWQVLGLGHLQKWMLPHLKKAIARIENELTRAEWDKRVTEQIKRNMESKKEAPLAE